MNFQFSILEFLVGAWTFDREFDNGSSGIGTVNFIKNKFYGLEYSELGTLKLVNGTVLTAKRKYYFSATEKNLEIYFFETPKVLFQGIELKIKGKNIIGKATHHCGDDFYDSEYVFKANGTFQIKHKVVGDKKKYLSKTNYRKISS
ncbi:MAG: hypothetical protein CMP78_01865 [Formosa sp.]|nr:hypothetical protein [Formosa sp.]